MSFKRETIIVVGAIVGANLLTFSLQPSPGQSSSCLQWANDAIDGASYNLQRTFNPPRVPEGMSEGEYNQEREIFKTDDIRVVQPQTTTASSIFPTGMTEADYQAKRHALQGGGN